MSLRRTVIQVRSGLHRIRVRGRSSALALTIGAAAAGGACTTATDPVPVRQITVLPAVDSVEAGLTSQGFSALLFDQSGQTVTGRRIQWSSSDPSIATVDAEGKVHGVAVGQVIISATVDSRTATATAKVILPIAQIQVTPQGMNLQLTTSKPIVVQLVGPNGEAITGRTISWASSDPSVATVSSTGMVTGMGLGQATISVHAGSKTATVNVTVVNEPVVSVTISPAIPVQVVRLGQTFQLSATCYGPNGALQGRNLLWTSNNPSVATVAPSGLVSGMALGSAVITADCEQKTAQITIQVTAIPVSSVSVTPPSLTMLVGQFQQLSAIPKDSAGNVLSLTQPPRSVLWTSDNLLVATISGSGVVSAGQAGLAHVQVTVDGVASPIVDVNVQNVPVATVQVSSPTLNPKAGTQTQLSVVLRDANGNQLSTTGRQITWTSTDNNIATVSINGLLNALSPGQVTIQATCEGQTGFVQLTVVP